MEILFSFLPEKAAVRRNLLRIEQSDDVTVVQRRVKRKRLEKACKYRRF